MFFTFFVIEFSFDLLQKKHCHRRTCVARQGPGKLKHNRYNTICTRAYRMFLTTFSHGLDHALISPVSLVCSFGGSWTHSLRQ